MSFVIESRVEISDELVSNLLCCAFEGGSNYWYMIERYEPFGINKQFEFPHITVPLTEEGTIVITDKNEEDGEHFKLNRLSLARGLQVMVTEYSKHFQDILDETEDAATGDIFLQCCLFGKVIFG